jgi:hypothetical protein
VSDTNETTTEPAEDLAVLAVISEAEQIALDGIRPDLGPTARDRLATPATRPATGLPAGTYLNIEDGLPQSLVQPWHSYATPASVLEARRVLDVAIAADRAARAEFAELPAREAREVAELGRAAVAGDPLPDLTDWHRERLVLVAKHCVLAEAVKAAKVAYREAITAALPQWRADLVAAIEPARQAAREAFRGVPEAVATWRRTLEAAHAVDAAVNKGDGLSTRMTREAREVAGPGAGATTALAKYLASDDEIITGRYLERLDPHRPTMYQRRVLDETASGATELEAIETAERGSVSTFTRHYRNAHLFDRARDNQSAQPAPRQVASDSPFADDQRS